MPTTRSSTKAARVEDDDAPLVALAESFPEILNLIGDALAADEDALQPRHLGALSRSCKVVKAAVKDSLAKVKVEHEAARALCSKCSRTLEWIVERRRTMLFWMTKGLTAADVPALVSVLKSEALVRLEDLWLHNNELGDEGAAAIAAAAAGGGLPRLKLLDLSTNQVGDSGVQALATAFADGAFRELEDLYLGGNQIGDAGVTTLAAALENAALPALKGLYLNHSTNVGDEGLKALMAAAGKGRLAKLKTLHLYNDTFGEEGIEALAVAIENGKLPSLNKLFMAEEHHQNPRLVNACAERGFRFPWVPGGAESDSDESDEW